MAAAFLAMHGIDLQAEMDHAHATTMSALTSTPSTLPLPPPQPVCILRSVLLPSRPGIHHDIHVSPSGIITSITLSTSRAQPAPDTTPEALLKPALAPTSLPNTTSLLVVPSLCHPHIHLDKPYLLSHPCTSHLTPSSGSFSEALSLTSSAKELFTRDSLLERGNWLIASSISHGVTAMRAFVEADSTVDSLCVEVGADLKRLWKGRCEIQLCVFAQEKVFSGSEGEGNRRAFEKAVKREEVQVVGSAPYVEESREAEERNVKWIVELAISKGKGLDFHLDYYLDEKRESLIWYVLSVLKEANWVERTNRKTVCLGHCTRLTRFSSLEWDRLREEVADLPVYFVGLPTSDLFMMGRPEKGEEKNDARQRGTLQVIDMKERGFRCAIGVNNVGNAFTPQGSADPLSVAQLGVGLYQTGTEEAIRSVFECVSSGAREAIGLDGVGSGLERKPKGEIVEGDKADLLLIGRAEGEAGPFHRRRENIREVVCDAGGDRLTIHEGKLVRVE